MARSMATRCRWCGNPREIAVLATIRIALCPHCDYVCIRGAGCSACSAMKNKTG